LIARYLKIFNAQRPNKLYDIPTARTVTVRLRSDKLMWWSRSEERSG